jgi:uncharacterized protein
MKRRLEPSEKQALIGAVSSFLQKRKEILFAYIHGSFVGEEAFSDMDIGVYLSEKDDMDRLALELDLESALRELVRIPADVRVLNSAPPSFAYHVIKRSIRVVDKEPNLRADFEGRIFKHYFDMSHYRKRYLKDVADAPL